MTEKRFTLTNRSLSEIGNDVAIADDGVPCTQRFVCNLLNELTEENEQLKHDATVLIQANQDYRRENEQLKQFQEQVASVIESKMGDNVCNDYKMEVLKEIWNELELDEVWFE